MRYLDLTSFFVWFPNDSIIAVEKGKSGDETAIETLRGESADLGYICEIDLKKL